MSLYRVAVTPVQPVVVTVEAEDEAAARLRATLAIPSLHPGDWQACDVDELTEDDLLPCPFCGTPDPDPSSETWCDDDGEHPAVECNHCRAMTPLDVWNRRA